MHTVVIFMFLHSSSLDLITKSTALKSEFKVFKSSFENDKIKHVKIIKMRRITGIKKDQKIFKNSAKTIFAQILDRMRMK